MKHLLLVLDGPLQSWGSTAPFWPERPTEIMPTCSGVAGLIANALGYDRGARLEDLANAEMHVRADRPGRRIEDYHTVGGGDPDGSVPQTGKGRRSKRAHNAIATRRHYLTDAAFTVHWTPAGSLTTAEAAAALRYPARPLYLGRRSCPPAQSPLLAETNLPAEEAFAILPLLADPASATVPAADGDFFADVARAAESDCALIACQSPGTPGQPGAEARYDVPVTFHPARRWQEASHRWIANRTRPYTADQFAGRGRQGRIRMLEALGIKEPV